MTEQATNHHRFISHPYGWLLGLDGPPPGARFLSTAFDVPFESLEIAQHSLAHDPGRISHSLDEAVRIIFQLKHDLGLRIREAMKCHHTGILCPLAAPPGNSLIWDLFRDLGIPFLFLATDFG